jgi:putative ABC transport system ATP-binding protein
LNLLTPRHAEAEPAAQQRLPVVDVSDVRFKWPGRGAFGFSLDRFALESEECVLLLGPSGGGKSTFLALLAGIVAPQAGRIVIRGTDISKLSAAARDRFRAEHIGIVFQMFNLLPYGSAIDNVLLPLNFAPARRARVLAGGRTPLDEAKRLLRALGLDADRVASQAASSLSVGQQQRVAAARALIGTPELIIADEPTSALDRNRQQAFLDLLFSEVKAQGSTLLMVSHDESLSGRFDRVLRLDDIARPDGSAAA